MNQELENNLLKSLDAIKHTVIYVGNAQRELSYVSRSIEQLLGYPVENYYQEGFWFSLIHPEDRVIMTDFFTRMDEINEFKVTARYQKADGSYQSLINSGTIIRENNTITSIVGNLKYLTEDESNKKILDINTSYSELLLDNIGLIFYAVDKDFRIVAKNKLFDKWVWEKYEVIYRIGDSIFHHKLPEKQIKEYTKAFQYCMSNGFFTMRFPGEDREYELAFSPILLKNSVEGVSVYQFNKSSERNLVNTASYLSNAIENKGNAAQEMIYILDKDFQFISFNEAFGKLYFNFLHKYPIIGHLNEFIQGDSIVSINLRNWYSKALSGDNIDTVLYLGDQVIHLRITPNYNNDHEICGLTAVNKDITTLNESQKKLIESEEKYKYVVDHVTDIVFQTDQEGYWSYLNNAWKNIMEYEIGESIGTLFFNYLHPDDVERNQILFTPLINREKSYCTHEIRYVTKSGKIKWIRVFATLLLDKEDNIMGTTGTLKDITLEKENSYRYELLSKNLNDLICLLETDGTFLYVSPSFTALLGYPVNELTNSNVKDFLHPDDMESIIGFSNDEYKSKNLVSYTTYRFKNKSGGYHWIETNAKMFYDDFYGRNLINASSRIIDERKILEQQLINSLQKERDLNQLKSKFVSMASHEFRTPMTTIKTSAELAALYLENPSETSLAKAKKHVETIDEEIDRLSNLINDILLLGKIESDSFQLNKTEQDITVVLQEVIKKQNGLQDDKRSTSLEIKGQAKPIEIDRNYMDLIFDNLLSNAFKYSKNKPSPEIKLAFLEEGIQVIIKDYGIGIPEVEQSQMFKSFFRASNAQALKGTGIGLVLVHYFIDLHHGQIDFESVQNIGTKFIIQLPYRSEIKSSQVETT